MFPYYYDQNYFFWFILTAIPVFAHFRVNYMLRKYSKIKSFKKITGADSAEYVLEQNGVIGVDVNQIYGYFNDYYDPRIKKIFLSSGVYANDSLAAIGVAAHEAGHAVQHDRKYKFAIFRQKLVPATQFCSSFAFPVILMGFMLPPSCNFIMNFGILLFTIVVVFHIITLPVEYDASNRAIDTLKRSRYFSDSELACIKKILNAAAMTYLSSLFLSFIQLLRLIFISSSRENKNKR
ncbi:MAG: zinc metallopeptidase [Candidatus Improbicoccus devescovinae]|nr:MAG: zinc metallopeptidase [Candidatus Improbicoccus devescovinae]